MMTLQQTLDRLTQKASHMPIALVGDIDVSDVESWVNTRLQAQGEHPDKIVFPSTGVGIDLVRDLLVRLSVRPFTEAYYVIIPHAHTLSRACVNALLKVLEEPTHVWFLLMTPHEYVLPQTIRSRLLLCHFSGDKAESNISLYDDLRWLMDHDKPLMKSEHWAQTISSHSLWLETFWKTASSIIHQEFRHLIDSDPMLSRLLALQDDVLETLAMVSRNPALGVKKSIEKYLIMWSCCFHQPTYLKLR
jgi:hypothetical protein